MKKKIFLTLLCLVLLSFPISSQAAVKLNAKKKTLVVNQTFQLKLKGTSQKAVWSSSNSNILTVSDKGKVKAIKSGTAYAKVALSGNVYKCKIKVVTPSMSTTKTVDKGYTVSIKIKNKKSFSSITYKSTNKKIATVTKKGKVKGIQTGTCYIKVRFNKAYTVNVKVTVQGVKTSSAVNVMKGSRKKLTPAHKGSGGTYTVLYPAIGRVVNGVYESKAYGWNQVTYKCGRYQHTFSIKNYCWEAHRGYTAVYPDDTLEAIKAAKAAGANSVEIDVRASRDGYFVLLHSSKLDTITNGALTGSVQNFYLSTLQKENYIYKNGKRYHIATLEEALKLTKQLGLHASVEMKTLPSVSKYVTVTKAEMTKRLCQIVKQYGDGQTSIIVQTEENAKLLVNYSGGTIPIRITNDAYAKNSALREIARKYSFVMPSTEFASKYYKGYLLTQDNPF